MEFIYIFRHLHPAATVTLGKNFWLLVIYFTLMPLAISHAQVIYVLNQNLMEEIGGQVTQINTGFNEHNFISVSSDNLSVTFSSPDPVNSSGVPPSSDIYSFNRATKQTRKIVNHTSDGSNPNSVQTYLPLSGVLSPNNQLIAYGVELTIRQGLANPQSTRELNIARASDGFILANPTFGRGPVSDSFRGEFVGISWDPSGNSFVTPHYTTVLSTQGTSIDLPAIVRFTSSGNGAWSKTVLTTPGYDNSNFPQSARTHIYPAISPSGAGLAFFSITWPDALGMSQGVISRVIVANSNGTNPFVLTTFNQGWYPSGLAWSANGTQLYVGIAPQARFGTSLLPSADSAGSVIRAIDISTGTINRIGNVDSGYWPNTASKLNIPSPSTIPQQPVGGFKRGTLIPILQLLLN